jgi:hypothetical protein
MGAVKMIGFFEKTWFAWWIFSNLVILRWFHLMRLNGPAEPYTDHRGADHVETKEERSALVA